MARGTRQLICEKVLSIPLQVKRSTKTHEAENGASSVRVISWIILIGTGMERGHPVRQRAKPAQP
jgi:hypothetical protein